MPETPSNPLVPDVPETPSNPLVPDVPEEPESPVSPLNVIVTVLPLLVTVNPEPAKSIEVTPETTGTPFEDIVKGLLVVNPVIDIVPPVLLYKSKVDVALK